MKKTISYFTIILLITLFSGCQTGPNKQVIEKEGHILVTSDNYHRIIEIRWVLMAMKLDGQDYPLAGEKPYIQFDLENNFFGFGSLNQYFGIIKVNKRGKLEWAPVGATKIAGPEKLMKQEDLFFKTLSKIGYLSTKGIYLYADSFDNQSELIFYVPPEYFRQEE